MKQTINTLKLLRRVWAQTVRPGDCCVDATAGRGYDTAELARLTGSTGRVLAFDIQPEALASTKALLTEQGLAHQVQLILDNHVQLAQYVQAGTVALIVFNLGYLPGGDHQLATKGEETVQAIKQGLKLLRPGGVLTLCIYHGGDSGFDERDTVLAYLKTLDYQQYTVLVTDFYNRPHYPPLAAILIKDV